MSEHYPWQMKYQEAVLETDDNKLEKLIAEVDELIIQHLDEGQILCDEESIALVRTKIALEVLKSERLSNLRHQTH